MAAGRTTVRRASGARLVRRGRTDSVEANARLTGSTAALLLVLLAAEGATLLSIHSLLTPHVVIGMVLVPPVLVKTGTTGYRFVRYYLGDPAYRRKGPPHVVLRLLGPFVVVSTGVVLASGVALLYAPHSWRSDLMLLHKASFVLWFGAMTLHVLGHLGETARLGPRDWYGSARRDVRGAGLRQWVLVVSVVAGILLAVAVTPSVGHFVSSGFTGG